MAKSAFEEAYNKSRNEQAKKEFQNTPSNWSGYVKPQVPTQTVDLDAVGRFLNMLKTVIGNRLIPNQTVNSIPAPTPIPQVSKHSKIMANIRQAYQTLGGATPELDAQVPIMATQIEKYPYLYPTYPALPFAETSLGKKVTYPGNNFNWGVTMKPYPLTGYSPDYITERVASRLTTDPQYAKFRASPSVQSLQESGYAPVGSNPFWNSNMTSAIQAFPSLDSQF